jgi:hypothetical protein
MKILRAIALLILSLGLLINATSCVVLAKKDNGNHLGWYKNPHNPHHPQSNNPGHNKQYKKSNTQPHPKSNKSGKSGGKHK